VWYTLHTSYLAASGALTEGLNTKGATACAALGVLSTSWVQYLCWAKCDNNKHTSTKVHTQIGTGYGLKL